jgi:hypothetical protein
MSNEQQLRTDAETIADALDDEFTQGRVSNHTGRKAATQLRMMSAALSQPSTQPNTEVDTGPLVLREVFALCEATEEQTVTPKPLGESGAFFRGRKFEAKSIRKAIGTWFQDEFCGMSFMGEPATQSQPSPVGTVSDEQLPPLPNADAYQFQHNETGQTMFIDGQQVEWGFEANNPRLHKIGGAYTAEQMREYAKCALLALKPEQVLQCGHHISLAINSSESGEFLYCDLCDARSQRNDAQQMERELSEELAAHSAMFGETNPAPVAQVHDKKPRGWLCELAQEDGTIRTQFVEEDPSLTLWNDIGEPTPVHVTPLFD